MNVIELKKIDASTKAFFSNSSLRHDEISLLLLLSWSSVLKKSFQMTDEFLW